MRVLSITLALVTSLVVAAPVSAASKGYTTKGHHKAEQGNFRVQFSGEGTWSSAYHYVNNSNGISNSTTFNDESSYKWNWEQNANRETVVVPASCNGPFRPLCRSIVGASLVRGRQSLNYKVDDSIIAPPDAPQTAKCADSLQLQSTGATDKSSIGITIKPSHNGSTLTFSQLSESPFANPESFFDHMCQGLDSEELWTPGGDGSVSTSVASRFFHFKSQPIPTHVLQTSDTIVIGVTGPSSGNGPKSNCGNTDDSVTCTQKGGWSGKITLARVHH